MSLLTSTKPLDELGDLTAPIGTRSWVIAVANEIRKALYDKEQSGRRLQDLIEVFKQHAGWQEFGVFTWEEYCEKWLQTKVEEIETEVARRATEAKPLLPNHRPSKGSNNYAFGDDRGADYLTARIARDRPDILEDMKQGKYRSVRQAAIEAGIVTPTTRYSLPDDPAAAGRYLAQRVDREWFDTLIDAYYKSIDG